VEPFNILLEDRMKVENVNWFPGVEPFVSGLLNDLNSPLVNVTGTPSLEK